MVDGLPPRGDQRSLIRPHPQPDVVEQDVARRLAHPAFPFESWIRRLNEASPAVLCAAAAASRRHARPVMQVCRRNRCAEMSRVPLLGAYRIPVVHVDVRKPLGWEIAVALDERAVRSLQVMEAAFPRRLRSL